MEKKGFEELFTEKLNELDHPGDEKNFEEDLNQLFRQFSDEGLKKGNDKKAAVPVVETAVTERKKEAEFSKENTKTTERRHIEEPERHTHVQHSEEEEEYRSKKRKKGAPLVVGAVAACIGIAAIGGGGYYVYRNVFNKDTLEITSEAVFDQESLAKAGGSAYTLVNEIEKNGGFSELNKEIEKAAEKTTGIPSEEDKSEDTKSEEVKPEETKTEDTKAEETKPEEEAEKEQPEEIAVENSYEEVYKNAETFRVVKEAESKVFSSRSDAEDAVIAKFPANRTVVLIEQAVEGETSWSHINYLGMDGWMKEESLDEAFAKTGEIDTSIVYVNIQQDKTIALKKENRKDAETVEEVSYGKDVTLLGINGIWAKVQDEEKEGWLPLTAVSVYVPGYFYAHAENQNEISVYGDEGSDSNVIGKIPVGTKLSITEFKNGRGKVQVDGVEGWALLSELISCSDALEEQEEQEPETAPEPEKEYEPEYQPEQNYDYNYNYNYTPDYNNGNNTAGNNGGNADTNTNVNVDTNVDTNTDTNVDVNVDTNTDISIDTDAPADFEVNEGSGEIISGGDSTPEVDVPGGDFIPEEFDQTSYEEAAE